MEPSANDRAGRMKGKQNLPVANVSPSAVIAQDASALQISHPVIKHPIFALVIGIDNYQTGGPKTLRGCVNDSNAMFAYLKDTLQVPETNIVLLRNEQATREKILGTFESHFINNSAITRGDAIIFYFAGHGSRRRAPVGWHSEDNRIETICPYDVAKAYGIPDYTFTHLLRQLAFYKGNNITLIFDSCHSGGMSRAEIETVEDAPSTRCYDPLNDLILPAELDHRIWSWNLDGGQSQHLQGPELPGSLYKAMDTHVLLAACQPRQPARETRNGGVWSGAFTTALIASLKAWGASTSSLTYSRLMEHFPSLDGQHPHCEGKNKVRRLFSPSDVGQDNPSYFVVTAADTDNAYYVAVGCLLGIVKGTEFITHPPKGYAPITLTATVVEEFRCLAVPHSKETAPGDPVSLLPSVSILPHHSRATISKQTTKWLRVELDPRDAFQHITEDNDTLFSVVASGGELKVSRADSAPRTVQVARNDPLIRLQPECHHISVDFDTFTCDYLDNAARFHFFLYQHNKSFNSTQLYHGLSLDPNAISVTASLQRLAWTSPPAGPPSFTPVGENLFREPAHADVTRKALAGAAVLEGSASNSPYALTLENHTSTDFFPYVFIFDPRKYAIVHWYLPQSHISHPLTRHGTDSSTLRIGCMAGTDNMTFSLPEGIDHDSAFVKVFVSTVYINMGAIVMNSERRDEKTTHPIEQCWDSWTYLVTVRR